MTARTLRSALAVSLALAVAACRTVPDPVPSPIFEAHRPRAITVLTSNRSSALEAGALVDERAREELDERGYGGSSSSARMHVVIEEWNVPTRLGAEPTISIAASLYDNASGALLWSSSVRREPSCDELRDPITDFITLPIDWVLGWTWSLFFPAGDDGAVEDLFESLPRRERAAVATR
jgi:hypothetical protein